MILTGTVVTKEVKFPVKMKFGQLVRILEESSEQVFLQVSNKFEKIASPSFLAALLSANITFSLNASSVVRRNWKKHFYRKRPAKFHTGTVRPVTCTYNAPPTFALLFLKSKYVVP